MRKKYRSRDIFEEEKKRPNILLPIIIFISVVTVLGVLTTLIFSLIDKHTEIDIPWISTKEEPKKKPTSSREQMDLVVPKINESQVPTEILNGSINITNITKDKDGFLITLSLIAYEDKYITMSAKQLILDGFYFNPTFELSDRVDYTEEGNRLPKREQQPTTYEFRVKKTELDDLDMFGFNNIKIIYDIENPVSKMVDQEYYILVNNDLHIVNERKGLIRVDIKNNVEVSYFKTIAAEDATYLYFDFLNENRRKDIKIYVKELIINNKIYDMSDFEDITHRSCREAIFLKIPTKDIPRVNTMKVRFVLVEENTKGEKSFYITNEYSRAY